MKWIALPSFRDDAEEAFRKHRLLGVVTTFWRYRLTSAGRALLPVFAVAGIVGGGLGIYFPLYHFALLLLMLLLVSQLAGLVLLPRVRLTRRLPPRCAAGATVTVQVELENRGWFPCYDLGVWETTPSLLLRQDGIELLLDHLPRGERAQLDYRLTPLRRGLYELPGPTVGTAFPFGFYFTARTIRVPQQLLVYPRFAPLEALRLPAGRRHQPGGLQLVSRVGDSEEFIGNREYRPGDRLRDLHHAAWARRGGMPIVREFQQEYLTRVALVVDTHIGARPSAVDRRRLEAGISLCAAVADALSRQEYVVDLFAAGPELYHLQAGRSLAYLDDILDVLACLAPCPTSPFGRLAPTLREELGQISTAVVVLLDWDEERLAFVRSLREAGVEVRTLMVRDEPAGLPFPAGEVEQLSPAQVEAGLGVL